MNNLVFNTVASELKTSTYGYNQDSLTLQLLQLDTNGNLLVSGNLTVSNSITIANETLTVSGDVTISNSVTIANETLTVSGDVTISNSVTIANETLTVSGDVTINNSVTIANETLTVSGDVTISNSVTVANETLTVLVSGQTFTSDTDSLSGVTGTGNVFTATNISTLTTASMFIDNVGTNTVTYSLMLSPDGTTYFEDPNYAGLTVAGGENAIIAIDKFAQFAQLQYDLGATTATFNAYYNGQA
jgi:hypothetical protein